uniref:Large proline-rich protein BAG6 n=1 Tax=Phallusia mammillata TaxID=59560 RepID=A0A6F9D875_9ASCI|nr:large proline-rich protein BAG6-like [Phallusia mammillata]
MKIVVKTMDSRSSTFTVAEQTSVREFKQTISSEVNVPPDRQRLIFQGRVLSDDFKLNKDHDGKVLHLVQRLPVSASSVASSTSSSTNTSAPSQPSQAQNANMFPTNQLAQVFQQALGSLGSVISGGNVAPPVISGTVLSTDGMGPNNQAIDFHIEVGSTSVNQQTPPTSNAMTNPTIATIQHEQRTFSAPRRQFDRVQHLLFHLNEALTKLETNNPNLSTGSAAAAASTSAATVAFVDGSLTSEVVCASESVQDSATTEGGDAAGGENDMETNPPEPPSTSSASASTDSSLRNRHPTLKELGKVYRDVIKAKQRLNPFLEYMADFLEKDPAFTSTESTEFRSTSRSLSLILQCQRLLSQIHGILSQVAIPLSRTPPRTMLISASQPNIPAGVRRHGVPGHPTQMPRPMPRGARPVRPNVEISATPWVPLPNQMGQRPGQGGGPQIRMVRMSAPIGPGGFQPPLLQFPHPQFVPNAPTYRPNAGGNAPRPTTAHSQPPRPAAQNQRPVAPVIPTPAPSQPESSITVDRPRYNVEVNASIQPYIHISVNPNNPQTSASQSQPASATANVSRMEVDFDSLPSFEPVVSSAQTITSGTSGTLPNLPNIPGLSTERLHNLIMDSVRQATDGQVPTPMVVEGQAGGQNQIASNVSNMVGQAVYNAVFNHLSGSSSTSASASTPGTTNTATTSQADQTPTTSTTATSSQPSPSEAMDYNQSSSVASSSSQETPKVDRDISADGLDKIISGGGFGSLSPKETAKPDTPGTSNDRGKIEVMKIIKDEIKSRGSLKSPLEDQPGTSKRKPMGRISLNPEDVKVPTGSMASMNDLARQLGYDFPSIESVTSNMAEKIMLVCGEEITNDESFEFFRGDIRPLQKLRLPLQKLFSKEFFKGKKPTLDDIKMAGEVLSESYEPSVIKFFLRSKSKNDIDSAKSNLALHKFFITKAMEFVFLADDSSYAQDFDKHIRYTLAVWVRLNEQILKGGRRTFAKVVLATNDIFSMMHDPLTILSRGLLRYEGNDEHPILKLFEALANFAPISQKDIDQFIVKWGDKQKVVDDAVQAIMDVIEAGTARIDAETARKKAAEEKAAKEAAAEMKTAEANTSSAEVPDENAWKKEVSPEWVETIVNDIEKQKSVPPQAPFSEAYMAGMPASKRRKIIA